MPLAILRLVPLLVLLQVACSDPVPPRWAPAERIAGSWQWVRSLDVRTTGLHTPASAGFEASIVFVAESDRTGTYVYRRSGAQPVSGRFVIGSEDAPGNDFISIDQPIDFLNQNAWIAAGPDALHLGGVFEMGFNSTYARLP